MPTSPATGNDNSISISLSDMESLGEEVEGMMREDAKNGFVWAFIAILLFMWVCVVVVGCFTRGANGKT